MNEDFEVRNLSEYSIEDLEVLKGAVTTIIGLGKHHMANDESAPDVLKRLDIWAYRIHDAIKKSKSENAKS